MDANIVNHQLQTGLTQLKARLERELAHLHDGMANLDPFSTDTAEQWSYDLYQRLIQRRRATLSLFFSA